MRCYEGTTLQLTFTSAGILTQLVSIKASALVGAPCVTTCVLTYTVPCTLVYVCMQIIHVQTILRWTLTDVIHFLTEVTLVPFYYWPTTYVYIKVFLISSISTSISFHKNLWIIAQLGAPVYTPLQVLPSVSVWNPSIQLHWKDPSVFSQTEFCEHTLPPYLSHSLMSARKYN